jgi:hypothetical protein
MARIKRAVVHTTGAGLILVCGFTVGSFLVTAAQATPGSGIAAAATSHADQSASALNGQTLASEFEVNARGQSFGSAIGYDDTSESLPDLVGVYTDQGTTGYVHAEEIFPEAFGVGFPTSPKEALALQESNKDRVLTAFDSDGITVVGTFTIAVGHGYGG